MRGAGVSLLFSFLFFHENWVWILLCRNVTVSYHFLSRLLLSSLLPKKECLEKITPVRFTAYNFILAIWYAPFCVLRIIVSGQQTRGIFRNDYRTNSERHTTIIKNLHVFIRWLHALIKCIYSENWKNGNTYRCRKRNFSNACNFIDDAVLDFFGDFLLFFYCLLAVSWKEQKYCRKVCGIETV